MTVRQCETCSVKYKTYGAARVSRWCSRACRAHFDRTRTGARSPLWRGGAAASTARYRAKREPRPRPVRSAVVKPKPKPRVLRICKACGTSGLERNRIYHPSCRPLLPMLDMPCVDCGAIARCSQRRPRKRCSACDLKRRGGELNPRWRGGITPENKRIRASREYAVWRSAVFSRDGFRCVWCDQRGGELHADHIKPFSTHPELRLEVSNGRTLCRACHAQTATFLGGARWASRGAA